MRPLVIGIAGGSDPGKSTLARGVTAASPARVVKLDMDGYYHNLFPCARRARCNDR